jgi:hypothetical protein
VGGKDLYVFDFPGPVEHDKDGREIGTGPYIVCLTAQLKGNYTRFINQNGNSVEGNNCKFDGDVVARKQRILVISRETIKFGNELSIWYGPNYDFHNDKDGKKKSGRKVARKAKKARKFYK